MLAWRRIDRLFKALISGRSFATSRMAKLEYYKGPLEGTAPYHRCYILLHARDRPSKFPKIHQTPISRELLARSICWASGGNGGGVSVNFSWTEDFAHSDTAASGKQPATVYSHLGGRLDIPDVTLNNMDEVERQILRHMDGLLTEQTSNNVEVYVCTHSARDCRCGERGQEVYDAFLRVVNEKKKKNRGVVDREMTQRIRIGAVGHVGGHKYAANVLIFPHGEWLGCVKPEDTSWIIERLIENLKSGVRPLNPTEEPLSVTHWRGRMGMTKDEMKALHSSFASQPRAP